MSKETIQKNFDLLKDEKIWIDAATTRLGSVQALIDYAENINELPLIVCNPIHEICGISNRLQAPGTHTLPTWDTVTGRCYVPSFSTVDEFQMQEKVYDVILDKHLFVHYSIDHRTNRRFLMCDIMDHGVILLKLSTFSDEAFCLEELRFLVGFSNTLYVNYFRLHTGTISASDEVMKYFQKILYSSDSLDSYNKDANDRLFPDGRNFVLMSFHFKPYGEKNLLVPTLIQQLFGNRQISIKDDDNYVMMISWQHEDNEKLEVIHREAIAQGICLCCSPFFGHKVETAEKYGLLKQAMKQCMDFANLKGLIPYDSIFRFFIYDQIIAIDTHKKYVHGDAIMLHFTDDQNGTEYESVLFTWLLHGCNASRAAEAMYVHRNTLNNKLNKINELLGERDWDNEDYRFKMLYSLYQYLKEKGQLREYHILSPYGR